MTTLRYSAKKIADLEAVVPGITKLWKAIKADTETTVRCPKSLWITDVPTRTTMNDDSCGRRYAVDLETMTIRSAVHVSCGEWATANRGEDAEIRDIPMGAAVVTCEWNSYRRWFSMTIEVAKGSLPASLKE